LRFLKSYESSAFMKSYMLKSLSAIDHQFSSL